MARLSVHAANAEVAHRALITELRQLLHRVCESEDRGHRVNRPDADARRRALQLGAILGGAFDITKDGEFFGPPGGQL